MIKNAPTGFDKRNRPALYMYIEEMVSEKTNSEGLFEKKPFSSHRRAECFSFRVVQLT